MSKEKLKLVHLIYGICLSALLVTLSVLLIVMCLDIYNNSLERFTRQSVWEHFTKIAVFVFLTIAAIIGGGILSTVAPLDSPRLKGSVKDALVLNKLSKQLKKVSTTASEQIEKQRIIRFAMIIVSVVLVIGASVASLVHILMTYDATVGVPQPGTNVTVEMARETGLGALRILFYYIAPISYLLVTYFVCKKSIKKEIKIVKDEIKNQLVNEKKVNSEIITDGEADKEQTDTECVKASESLGPITKLTNELNETVNRIKEPKKWHKILFWSIVGVLAITAIVFVIVGGALGGAGQVSAKAVRICKECIGMA